MTTAVRTDPRLKALRRANQIRTARKHLKRDLKRGKKRPAALFLDPPAHAETMKVSAVLLAVPRIGPVGAERVLRRTGIGASKPLGELTERQRAALVAEVTR